MAQSKREADRCERQLKELLKLPENKRCPNCDSLGPQYVVSQFNIFVCTQCSGVHRQFGHRVKGVSMSSFKPDEIKALQEGGNGRFLAQYLAKWTQTQLPKPTDRSADRVREWIQAVYEGKRFYDASKEYVPPAQPKSARVSSDGKEIRVQQLSDVLGAGTPKLVVSRTDSVEKSPPKGTPRQDSTAAPSAVAVPVPNLLDVASPKVQLGTKAPAVAAAAGEAWDAFSTKPATPAAAAAAAPAAAAAAAAAPAGWAAFGDGSVAAAPAAGPPASSTTPRAAAPPTAAQAPSSGGWEAFGEQSALPPMPARPAPPSPIPAKAELQPQPVVQPQQAQQQPPKDERREVPLDAFFPEFEQIRATGLMPNGQPAPMPVHAQQYAGYGAMPVQQAYGMAPQQSYGAVAHPGYGYVQQPAGGYQAAPRPTVAIPPGPVFPGGMMPSPSPGMQGHITPAGYGTMPGFSPKVSTPGSAGSAAQSNGSASYEAAPAVQQQQQQQQPDPFSSLGPVLKSAMPSFPSAGAPRQVQQHVQQQYGVPAPGAVPGGYPAAAGVPPPAAAPPQYAMSPAAYSAAPSPAGAGPTSGSPFGSSSLFSGPPSLAAMPYDLSAPAAPKPKASGNPFA